MAENNHELVEWEDEKDKALAQRSWTNARDVAANDQRELERDRMSRARPGGAAREPARDTAMQGSDVDQTDAPGVPRERVNDANRLGANAKPRRQG